MYAPAYLDMYISTYFDIYVTTYLDMYVLTYLEMYSPELRKHKLRQLCPIFPLLFSLTDLA